MPSRPSDEEEVRRRAGVLLLACDTLLRDLRRAYPDGDWRVDALRRLRRTLIDRADSSTA
jgi:hypothetical protein